MSLFKSFIAAGYALSICLPATADTMLPTEPTSQIIFQDRMLGRLDLSNTAIGVQVSDTAVTGFAMQHSVQNRGSLAWLHDAAPIHAAMLSATFTLFHQGCVMGDTAACDDRTELGHVAEALPFVMPPCTGPTTKDPDFATSDCVGIVDTLENIEDAYYAAGLSGDPMVQHGADRRLRRSEFFRTMYCNCLPIPGGHGNSDTISVTPGISTGVQSIRDGL